MRNQKNELGGRFISREMNKWFENTYMFLMYFEEELSYVEILNLSKIWKHVSYSHYM